MFRMPVVVGVDGALRGMVAQNLGVAVERVGEVAQGLSVETGHAHGPVVAVPSEEE